MKRNIALAGVLSICVPQLAMAETQSRPQARPSSVDVSRQVTDTLSVPASMRSVQLPVRVSLRPEIRPATFPAPEPLPVAGENARFHAWIGAFRDRAQAQGIRSATLDAAFAGVRYDSDVIRLDRNQSEFSKTIWQYLDSAVSDSRVTNGKTALQNQQATLLAIERKYGVDKEVVVAIWGLETNYGTFRGSNNVIEALSTLAFDGRRAAFFEDQLIAALQILQTGDTTPANMKGSWAGAMGHTQFMPTSYLEYAVDFTGNARRDIWSDDPADALASTAAYLKRHGWTTGQPWGVEVSLPRGFDYALADRQITKVPSAWAALGVTGADGRPVPNHGNAAILLPAGGQGAAFMIFDNFAVIERYNSADAYVIGVGHLSDRIGGGPTIQHPWPREDRALTFSERKEMQERLTAHGFDTKGIDGRIGPRTVDAVRAYQQANNMLPDGYASLAVLKRLR
ncbi:lytic murein transglycosylase [Chachezhania antarctica]|uniref:lytic murein transglycosylase n=1 Tax=Chachezhania antarctica TaxID=2340860 RepID=UPI000EB26004|nr:lytic murein transglycosylase [Chachezhania antarctica]